MAIGPAGLTLTLTLAVGAESAAMAIRIAVAARATVMPPVAAIARSVATAAAELLRSADVALVHREFRYGPGHW